MNDKIRKRLDRVTQLDSRNLPKIEAGDVFPTNRGGDLTVIANNGHLEILVKFNDDAGYETVVSSSSLRQGVIKNPYAPLICGVGFIGVGAFTGKELPIVYDSWRGMLRRCYEEAVQKRHPTYRGCTVHPDWHNFQNFANWYTSHDYYGFLGHQLDKDLLIRGNKVYSSETCSLVPAYINCLLTNLSKPNAKNPLGVIHHKKKNMFQASLRVDGIARNLGYFDCPQEAHKAYVRGKEMLVRRRAMEYRYEIEEKVFNSLMQWRFYE